MPLQAIIQAHMPEADGSTPIYMKGAREYAPLVDSRGCQVGNPERISQRYETANKRLPAQAKWYYEQLKLVLYSIIRHGAHPYSLSDFFAQAVKMGLPIDQNALFAPEAVLASEARFMALCIPSLKNLHEDCRQWLSVKLKKPPEKIEGSAGWNALLGGIRVGE